MVDRERGTGVAVVAVLLVAVILASCRGDRELATEHIRATLDGAPPAAETTADEDAREPESSEPAVVSLSNGDTLHIRDAVADFYRARAYEPAWTDHKELTDAGMALLDAIGALEEDGLEPARYQYGTARQMAGVLSDGEAGDRKLEYLGDLDLLLAESFVRAAMDLGTGALDPERVGLEWQFERAEVSDSVVVARLAAGEAPAAVLASLRPQAPYYHRLARALSDLREVEASGGWPGVSDGETLESGDRDGRVAELRARLRAGEDAEERRLAGSGREDPTLFDDDLERALGRFQARHTLHEDGAFGPSSRAALNVPVGERIETVRLNLDRWRWLSGELGEEFLLVNVAGFELELVARDTVVESMSVVVGRTANRTPLFRDSLQYVVVNPYWNVPINIAREDIIPALRRDPGYLGRNGYEVLYDGNVIHGYVSPEALETGRYLIRQLPGPQNALGNVKFMFPNDMNIYLHDTPAGHLFSQESRAFSFGCIRVERPDDLARTLLARYTSGDGSEYDRLRGEHEEQWVTLERKIPIYILYFTAWAREDGTLRFHPDIYERDRALEAERARYLPPRGTTGSRG